MDGEQPSINGDKENITQELETRLKEVKTMDAIIALKHGPPNRKTELQ